MEIPGKGFVEGSVDADGFRIGYREAGKGPALVLLPGSAGMEISIAAEQLAKDFRVVAFEPPGWGTSPDNPRTKSLRELAKTMAAAIQVLGIDKYNLVGTSMGGTVALWVAAFHPERVTSLILEGSMSFRRDHWTPMDPKQAESMMEMILKMPPHPRKPWANADFVREQFRRRLRVIGMVDAEFDGDLAARLRNLKVPALVLYGANDMIVRPSLGEVYKQILANGESLTVEGAGHDIQGEQPEKFAELVRNFIERVSSARASTA